MDSLIEFCDKRFNEILCDQKQSPDTGTRQNKWIFFYLIIFVWADINEASRIRF